MSEAATHDDVIRNEKPKAGDAPSEDVGINSKSMTGTVTEQEKIPPEISPEPSSAPPEYAEVVPPGTILSTPVTVPLNQLGLEPAQIDCPNCQMTTMTVTRKVDPGPDQETHTCALIVCCLVGPLFAWMPYAFRTKYEDTFHDCANCKKPLAYREQKTGVTQVIPTPLPKGMQPPGRGAVGVGERPVMSYGKDQGK